MKKKVEQNLVNHIKRVPFEERKEERMEKKPFWNDTPTNIFFIELDEMRLADGWARPF